LPGRRGSLTFHARARSTAGEHGRPAADDTAPALVISPYAKKRYVDHQILSSDAYG
jgi:hypothetical protein